MKKITVVPCPICKKLCRWDGNPNKPFCSERCKTIDLGNWATESYSIEVTPDITAEELDHEEYSDYGN